MQKVAALSKKRCAEFFFCDRGMECHEPNVNIVGIFHFYKRNAANFYFFVVKSPGSSDGEHVVYMNIAESATC